MIPRLKEQYEKKIINELQKEFSLKNKLMVPKFLKIVINMGLGNDGNDKKILKSFILGKAIFTSLSINSYIFLFLKVTLTPAGAPFLVLKFDIDFLNFFV